MKILKTCPQLHRFPPKAKLFLKTTCFLTFWVGELKQRKTFHVCLWIISIRYRKKKKVTSLSHVRRFATPWTVAYQAPPSMGFSRQKYWNRLPFTSPGDLPNPGIEPTSPTLQADTLPSEPPGKPKLSGGCNISRYYSSFSDWRKNRSIELTSQGASLTLSLWNPAWVPNLYYATSAGRMQPSPHQCWWHGKAIIEFLILYSPQFHAAFLDWRKTQEMFPTDEKLNILS